jgi:circadian clock protein KaiC
VTLEQNEKRRFISVQKMRGTDYHAGRHALRIKGDGLHVYPQLVPRRHSRDFIPEVIASGVTALDAMLHGGLERGTITLITGPLGVGKTTVGMHFMKEAAHHGERSVAYLFEEGLDTVVQRCESIGIPAKRMVAEQNLALIPVDPLALTAEEFAYHVRQEVEVRGARILMLDSVAGYQLSIRGGEDIPVLHALIRYLRNMGITIIVINEADMTSGFFSLDNLGFSYLADNVIFMRYIEKLGELQKTIGVLKKRASDFDKAMRELDITDEGIKLGPPVTNISDLVASAFVGSGHVTPIEEEEI